MHQASLEVSTARLPDSGTAAQNCRSRTSACDSTERPALAILSSRAFNSLRSVPSSWPILSSIWRTALTLTSLKTVERESNRKILSELQQHRLVHFGRGCSRRHGRQSLPQGLLCVLGKRGEFH